MVEKKGGRKSSTDNMGKLKRKKTERKRSHKYINAPLSQKESSASSLQTPLPPPPTRDSPAGRNFRLSFFFRVEGKGGGGGKWEGLEKKNPVPKG